MKVPSPLRSSRFRWFFTGRTLSFLGSSMAPVALAFAVLDITGSPASLGIVLAARSIPMAALMLVGGVISDRFSRSTVLVVSNSLTGLSQGLAATLLITGNAEVWSLAVIEAVNGVVVAFTFPAMQSVIPMVVDRDDLQQTNAILSFSRQGMFVIGPSLAGLFVVTIGSGWAIAVDGASYVVSAFCMSRLHLRAVERTDPSSMVADLREGWGVFVSMQWVWVVVSAFGVLNMIHAGVIFTLGPVIAKDTIGEGAWGAVLSAESVGFLVTTLVLMRVRLRYPLRAGMLGMASLALPMLALGAAPQTLVLATLMFLAGVGTEIFGIGWSTAMHENVPNELQSRLWSYDAFGSFVAIPIGQLLAGPLAAAFDARTVAVVAGALYAVVALAALLSPDVRRLRHEAEAVSPPRADADETSAP
ncbi:MFS transporter [Solicola gregarius]|uniref:MFS transporter n=1 Tax=Solicola gregarius TaxID=2908642 RepID=A0AA46YLX2_9ACTN|nr:MFS transporter [Solicola gregarius]UYM06044.1 MFS transporter [Solicola gregarius]